MRWNAFGCFSTASVALLLGGRDTAKEKRLAREKEKPVWKLSYGFLVLYAVTLVALLVVLPTLYGSN